MGGVTTAAVVASGGGGAAGMQKELAAGALGERSAEVTDPFGDVTDGSFSAPVPREEVMGRSAAQLEESDPFGEASVGTCKLQKRIGNAGVNDWQLWG